MDIDNNESRTPILDKYDVAIYKNDNIATICSTVKEAAEWIPCNYKYLYRVLRTKHTVKGYEVYLVER